MEALYSLGGTEVALSFLLAAGIGLDAVGLVGVSMLRNRQFVVFIGAVLGLPGMTFGQTMPPPIPTGPPLVAPQPEPIERPAWIDSAVVPAGGVACNPNDWLNENWNPLIGAPVSYGSSCQFDATGGLFLPGANSMQMLAGAYFTSTFGPCVPVFNYLPITVRQGWMLTAPNEEGRWRGNWEFLADVTAAQVISSYGNYLAGSSLFLRYNFLSPDSVIVPYSQVGGGVVFTDAYKDQTQRAIGQGFELIFHYELGLKYFVAPNLSLDIEGGYQHISNARMASRNCGVNALGAQIGVTYYFPWGTP